MARVLRQKFGIRRLDKKDPELETASGVKVFVITARADSERALRLLLDPRKVLLEEDLIQRRGAARWRITVNRVNAQEPIPQIPNPLPTLWPPKGPGPHHIVAVWTVVEDTKEAHCVLYRVPPP
jgi:hypothetical protein